jgi:DNA-binding NarL/FixJ family response regulator
MPDENGTVTYKRLKRMNPDIKVLISTGYGTDGEVEEIVRDSQNGLIHKPFKFKELSSKIEAIFSMN